MIDDRGLRGEAADEAFDAFDRMVATEANSPGTAVTVRGATQEIETPMPDKRTERLEIERLACRTARCAGRCYPMPDRVSAGQGETYQCATCRAVVAYEDGLPDDCLRCGGAIHASDCAVHNEPALPAGPCDCRVSAGHDPRHEALVRASADAMGLLARFLATRDEQSFIDARALLGRGESRWFVRTKEEGKHG